MARRWHRSGQLEGLQSRCRKGPAWTGTAIASAAQCRRAPVAARFDARPDMDLVDETRFGWEGRRDEEELVED